MENKGWQLLHPRKKHGPIKVWNVLRQTGTNTETGFYKCIAPSQIPKLGPLLYNEIIAYRLAKELGLPAAKTEYVRMKGKTGFVSLTVPVKRFLYWQHMGTKVHRNIGKYISHPDRLLKMFVFDVWICNLDRQGKNVLVYPNGSKFGFYLIDHGLSLTGAFRWRKVPPGSSYWNCLGSFNRQYLEGLPSYIRTYSQLEPYVQEIRNLSNRGIRDAVESVPAEMLSRARKELLIRWLLERRGKLPQILAGWIKDKKAGKCRGI